MRRELQYTRVKLDRADGLRRADSEIQKHWRSAQCKLVPLYNNKSLFDSAFNPLFPGAVELAAFEFRTESKSFLGLEGDVPYFSVRCTEDDASKLCEHYAQAEFHDLRAAGATLDPDAASILAYARGLNHWQSINVYCSRCGGPNTVVSAGHAMRCQQCQSQVFPRTDPAVIMLVEHADTNGNVKCLLGRSPAWPEGCYSTLAGFVETGESLEAAVIREVYEESGIVVQNPVYVSSQPWPFPQSIMLGYFATAVSSTIVLDQQELANADWFSAEEIAHFGEWADDSDGLKLPRKDSIARFLIDSWVAKQQQTQT